MSEASGISSLGRAIALFALLTSSPVVLAGLPSAPVEQWRWESDLRDPVYKSTYGSPIVVQLTDDDGDGRIGPADDPDVVFIAQGDFGSPGVVMILDGTDGSTHSVIVDDEVSGSLLAAADLDGDGEIEIVAGGPGGLVVFRPDGSRVRRLAPPVGGWLRDPIGIADFDQDGIAEVYSGAAVVSSDASWAWTGGFSQGVSQVLSGSNPVEWDSGSPGLELIAGGTLYGSRGAVLATDPSLPDGVTAVADLDGDGEPEIILASSTGTNPLTAEVRVLDRDFALIAGPYVLDEGQGVFVSGPVVADLDGDGLPEFVVPTTEALNAFEWTGREIEPTWRTPSHTISSATGATAFDFDGDGAAEIVYRDEMDWLILEGRDGSVLHRDSFPSGTLFEMPVVANIDDDPAAEILVPSLGAAPGPRGDLIAFEIPGSCTPRPIWNQQTYHVSNIADDGVVPRVEEQPWTTHGSWQAQVGSCCTVDVASPLEDLVLCLGDEAVLDASGTQLIGCSGSELYEWSDASGVVGTDPVLRVTPSETTVYTLSVRCDDDANCLSFDSVLVEVQAPAVFSGLTVADPSDCGLGLRLDWPAAEFASGSGSYHVYRSEGPAASCADALSRAPIASGLTALSWTDRGTVDGVSYVHVVEAEDAATPTVCSPAGPNGGAVTRACSSPTLESGDFASPAGLGAVLFASHAGDEVRLSWSGARALLAGEHFHLLKALGSAEGGFATANPEGDASLDFVETDRSGARQYFDLRVANGCEELSADEFPASGP